MEAVHSDAAPATWALGKNPWRRYGARIIDAYLFGELITFLAGALIGILGPEWLFNWVVDESQWKQMLVMTPLMWLCAMPLIAACVAWKGATPGKLLFGLRLSNGEGNIPYAVALRREGLVLFWGAGLALPLLNLIMMVRSYSEVESNGAARWDEATGIQVEARAITGWQIIGVAVGTTLVVGGILFSAYLNVAGRL